MINKGVYNSKISYFWIAGIFGYIMVYEIVFFFWESSFMVYTNIFKLIFPFGLLLFVGLNYVKVIKRYKHVDLYVLFYLIFLFWMFIPNFVNSGLGYGTLKWMQLFPRFFFLIALLCVFFRSKHSLIQIKKIIVLFSTITVILHFILLLIPNTSYTYYFDLPFAGPFGILGNVTGRKYLPFLDEPLYRLSGLFNEPSNASAFIFASFYLAKTLYHRNGRKIWRLASIICLIGGFLTFSNAGYLAIGCAIFLGAIRIEEKQARKSKIRYSLIPIMTGIFLIALGLYGRHYVYKTDTSNVLLRVATGAVRGSNYENPNYDFTGGRLALASSTINTIKNNPIGVGLDISINRTPAGAPLLWLLVGGIPGLILILLRESHWLRGALKSLKYSKFVLFNMQALIVVLVQQSVYGQWNNAFYYFLVANLLVNSGCLKSCNYNNQDKYLRVSTN